MTDDTDNRENDDRDSGNSYSPDLAGLATAVDTMESVSVDKAQLAKMARLSAKVNQQYAAALADFDFSKIDKAAAIAVNEDVFRAIENIDQTAVTDMYRVVEAAQQIEQTGGDKSKTVEGTETADSVENTFYDLIGTYISNSDEDVSDGVQGASSTLQSSIGVQEKREAFADLFKRADERTKQLLVTLTWVSIQVVIAMLFAEAHEQDT